MLSKPQIIPCHFDGDSSYELRILVAGNRHVAQIFPNEAAAEDACRFVGLIQEAIEIETGK